jgi:Ca-activated chloride channel family protein
MNGIAAKLVSENDQLVALESVSVKAELAGLLAHTTMTQCFRNLEDAPIEAVYTFPVPIGAVFLGLQMKIGEVQLSGQIMASANADLGYEEAIQDGDTAVLLREVEPGVYAVSVANIMSGELAEITYQYAQTLVWNEDELRLKIPTTLAPRYGDPAESGLAAHEQYDSSMTQEYGFEVYVDVIGDLATSAISSPSHRIGTTYSEGRCKVALSGSASMDRDFVLLLHSTEANRSHGVIAKDDDGWVADVGFALTGWLHEPTPDRAIKLVIDCSGSMAGDSIVQARIAAKRILDELVDGQLFNITLFGSSSRLLFKTPKRLDAKARKAASQLIREIAANMGGTAMAEALNVTLRSSKKEGQKADVLLITDGQCHSRQTIVADAVAAGARIFTVGVGTAVSEGLVRQIASDTNGACELVSPNEQMASHIIRHFKRMQQPVLRSLNITWPSDRIWESELSQRSIFAGDTLHAHALLESRGSEPVTVSSKFPGEETVEQHISLTQLPQESVLARALPRITAAKRLVTLSQEDALALALQYQLLTCDTKCLLVHRRSEGDAAEELPAIRQTPQQLPAGWGGTGSVSGPMKSFECASYELSFSRKARVVESAPSYSGGSVSGFF